MRFSPANLPIPTPLPPEWRPPAGWERWYAAELVGGVWRASFYMLRP